MDLTTIVVGAIIFGGAALISSNTWMTRLRRRLVGVGAWFPVMLWLTTLGLYVIALADREWPAISLPPAVGLMMVVGSPLAAMVLTLAWRDTRRGVVEIDPDPDDADAPVSDGIRVAAGVFAAFCAVGLVFAFLDGEWRETGLMLTVGGLFGYVAVTGRVPARFRGSV